MATKYCKNKPKKDNFDTCRRIQVMPKQIKLKVLLWQLDEETQVELTLCNMSALQIIVSDGVSMPFEYQPLIRY